jgi:hypothetical protein
MSWHGGDPLAILPGQASELRWVDGQVGSPREARIGTPCAAGRGEDHFEGAEARGAPKPLISKGPLTRDRAVVLVVQPRAPHCAPYQGRPQGQGRRDRRSHGPRHHRLDHDQWEACHRPTPQAICDFFTMNAQ